jgi:hypothetical protein
MINRKTKRNSPPPIQMTIATMDPSKATDTWSRMIQLISPPNKIRKAVPLIGQRSDSKEINADSSDSDETKERESLTKKKILHRRGMYIPPFVNQQKIDGPKDLQHKWALYRATQQKLRRNLLPLGEGLLLKKMLVMFQQDKAILQQEATMEFAPRKTAHQNPLVFNNKCPSAIGNHDDEEDNIPLGTLLEKTKRQSPSAHQHKQTSNTPPTSRPANYKGLPRNRSPTPPTAVHMPSYRNASGLLQPCYYYYHSPKQSYPVQFI